MTEDAPAASTSTDEVLSQATKLSLAVENETKADSSSKSALRENIDAKGKNAYYYAHSKTATGPKWDGKPEPKLLGRTDSSTLELTGSGSGRKAPSFDVHRSSITSYAFSDEGKKVKLYVNLDGVGERCCAGDGANDGNANGGAVSLDWTERSICLTVRNYPEDGQSQVLSFGRLHGPIEKGTFKTKKDRIVVTLVKKTAKVKVEEEVVEGEGEEGDEAEAEAGAETEAGAKVETKPEAKPEAWPAIGARGDPEQEIV